LARVKLRMYPPLYYRMSSQRAGVLALEQTISQGETLGELLRRLMEGHPAAWQDIVDAQTGQIRPLVMIFLNSRALSPSAAAQTPLADGDQIRFSVAYGGG